MADGGRLYDLDEIEDDDEDEEGLIRYYFFKGFEYEEIRLLLYNYHDIELSLSTLKRRIRDFGLQRRNPDYNLDIVRNAVRTLLDGPDSLRGYRSIWHSLQLNGIRVPRIVIEQIVRELDPEGVQQRAARRLRRRVYHNPGPNHSWHCDGYDKLKPFGFPIHGCIDGWSRKVIWLHVTRSNNLPSNIASYYLEAVEYAGGCPIDLVTDLGTENGLMAAIQAFFRDDPSSHRYVPSPRNQRIEGWWSFFRRSHTNWWINFFKDLGDNRVIDLTSPLQKECLWFCFSELLQKYLDEVKEHWNTHYIRRSRFDTVQGRPDSLYYIPELRGGSPNLLLPVPEQERVYAKTQVIDPEEENYYHDYFIYIMETCQLQGPENWQQALRLYNLLMEHALQ